MRRLSKSYFEATDHPNAARSTPIFPLPLPIALPLESATFPMPGFHSPAQRFERPPRACGRPPAFAVEFCLKPGGPVGLLYSGLGRLDEARALLEGAIQHAPLERQIISIALDGLP